MACSGIDAAETLPYEPSAEVESVASTATLGPPWEPEEFKYIKQPDGSFVKIPKDPKPEEPSELADGDALLRCPTLELGAIADDSDVIMEGEAHEKLTAKPMAVEVEPGTASANPVAVEPAKPVNVDLEPCTTSAGGTVEADDPKDAVEEEIPATQPEKALSVQLLEDEKNSIPWVQREEQQNFKNAKQRLNGKEEEKGEGQKPTRGRGRGRGCGRGQGEREEGSKS